MGFLCAIIPGTYLKIDSEASESGNRGRQGEKGKPPGGAMGSPKSAVFLGQEQRCVKDDFAFTTPYAAIS